MNKNDIQRFLDNVDKTESCWIWKGKGCSWGYGRMRIDGKQERTHRISYKLFKGEIPEGLFVCHSCDNPICVNPDHLWLGTASDNHKDMVQKNRHFVPEYKFKKGTKFKGEKNGKSKLTRKQVNEIRSKYIPRAYTQKMLAEEYDVTPDNIKQIISRKTWI